VHSSAVLLHSPHQCRRTQRQKKGCQLTKEMQQAKKRAPAFALQRSREYDHEVFLLRFAERRLELLVKLEHVCIQAQNR
jgi:hypothetical protein